MEALVWHGARDIHYEDVEEPKAGPGEVVVDVALAGICGSDLHAYRGAAGKRQPPLILGHEAVGYVDGDERLRLIFPLVGCQTCDLCRSGQENLCPDRVLLGLDRPGTFAPRVAVPTTALLDVPDGMSAATAALTEPCATVVEALSDAELAGRRVAVIGCGAIGLLAVHLAHQRGAMIAACDPVPERRQAAAAAGAETVVDAVSKLAAAGSDYVLDAVGVEETWLGALDAARPGGTVCIVGLAQASGSMPVGDLVRRGLTLRGSYAYTRDGFLAALQILATAPPPSSWLQQVPLSDGAAAFRSLTDTPSESVKVLLTPE